MTRTAADMLTARLLWPAPRIRWDAARSIATLIRSGDIMARHSLLDWIGRRTLESEVVLGLGVIDAFRLGVHFDFVEVYTAIRAPSILSDWMLARNFDDADALDDFRHSFAPEINVNLPPTVAASFGRYQRFAVPPVFAMTLASLTRRTGVGLTERWQHEWRWLQSQERRPIGEYPAYFYSGSNKGEVGSFDGAQREVFASAFLRTFHWASRVHGAPRKALELQSLIALPMNRGLADLSPGRRPRWAYIELSPVADPTTEARRLWANASAGLKPSERLIALNVAETGETSFAEYRFRLAAVPCGFQLDNNDGPADIESITLADEPGSFSGLAAHHVDYQSVVIDAPIALSQNIAPYGWGRVHIDLVSDLTMLSPLLAGEAMTVEAAAEEIVGRIGRRVASRWRYWHAGWSPAHPVGLQTLAPSLTTARRDILDRLAKTHNARFELWVDIRRGAREHSYEEMDVSLESQWLELPS